MQLKGCARRGLVALGLLTAGSFGRPISTPAAPLNPVAKVLVDEHADLFSAGYTANWVLHVMGYESGDFAPHDALAFVDRPARGPRSAGSSFDFIGVAGGQLYWRLPQTQNTKLLFAGVNANGVDYDTFASYVEPDPRIGTKIAAPWIKLAIVGLHGLAPETPAPGSFSIWSSEDTGPKVWVSSFEGGLTSPDCLFVLPQSHAHYNWGFTARGIYGVDVVASAYLGPAQTNPISSALYTFYFGVEAGLPGDANLDSIVDGADYTLWADNYLATGASFEQGDFNQNGVVDGADYTLWADNYLETDPPPAAAAVVPESSSLTSAAIAAGCCALAGRAKRRLRSARAAR